MPAVRKYLKHASFSTLSRLTKDPRGFYRSKVARLPETEQKKGMLSGSAAHFAAELYLTGKEDAHGAFAAAARYVELRLAHSAKHAELAARLPYLPAEDRAKAEEEMAKTATEPSLPLEGGPDAATDALEGAEKGLENFLQYADVFPAKEYEYEREVKGEDADVVAGLPLNGRIDALSATVGEVVDWKFVARFSEMNRTYDLQAWYYHYLCAAAGIPTFRARFVQFKKSKAKDGVGYREYVVEFDKSSPSHAAFRAWLRRANALLDVDASVLNLFMAEELSMMASSKPWDGTEAEDPEPVNVDEEKDSTAGAVESELDFSDI